MKTLRVEYTIETCEQCGMSQTFMNEKNAVCQNIHIFFWTNVFEFYFLK